MRTLHAAITIYAPIDRVFALSTSTELVRQTLGMALIEGPATVVANSRVHWRGRKFGLTTSHHTLITGFTAPHTDPDGTRRAFFQDSQESGRFAAFQHDHFFSQKQGTDSTLLEDRIQFELPLHLGGTVSEQLLLAPHIHHLALMRFALLKRVAESEEWRTYLTAQAA